MRYIVKSIFIFIALIASGCGGGSSSTTNDTTSSNKGYYLDSGIEGVKYICGNLSGLTSKGGEFKLENNKTCSFYLNSLKLRTVSNVFNGIKIIETNLTIAQFLQSLDADGDPSNGITILPEVAQNITSFPSNNTQLKNLIEKLKKDISNYNGVYFTLQEALEHLNQTIKENQPTAYDINITINEDNSAKIDLKATDPHNYNLKYNIKNPQNGTVSGTAPNLTYTPNPNFNGVDSFYYEVINPQGLKSTAKVTININPVNDAPTAKDFNITTNEDTKVSIELNTTAKDVDGDKIEYTLTTQPQNGTVSGTAPTLIYTPNSNFNGVDRFSFKVNDGVLNSKEATVTIKINPVNDAPTAEDINDTAYNGIEKNITLKGSDIDSTNLTYSITTPPSNGVVTVTKNSAKYISNRDFSGVDTFEYRVSDGSLSATAKVTITVIDKYIFIDNNNYSIVNLGDENITKTVRLESNKSLYIIISNATDLNQTVEINTTASSQTTSQESISLPQNEESNNSENEIPDEITKFNNETIPPINQEEISQTSIEAPLAEESEGDQLLFYYYNGEVNATLRKLVSNVDTAFGPKTLKIWVADDSFGEDCNKSKCLTQEMVDEMADAFLKAGLNNDIYDWVSNVYGEEWGPHNSSILIPDNDEITILLLDINNDDEPNGGTLGYFWAMENYKKEVYSKSNERVMFFIDSVIYANRGDDGTNDFWKIRLHSTLAHEFQHMIHYYQRNVVRGLPSDTWFNEMLSVTIQDAVASKIGDTAVRGIDPNNGTAGTPGIRDGRFPGFNANINKSLTKWVSSWSYSLVGSLGTYLTRNYGGVKILGDIQHSNLADEKEAIAQAVNDNSQVNKTFEEILRDWASAVMISNFENVEDENLRYNFGDFLVVDLNGISYDLGSINFFNYSPLPQFKTTSGIVEDNSNYYYKVGDNLSGDIDINVSLSSSSLKATLIAK